MFVRAFSVGAVILVASGAGCSSPESIDTEQVDNADTAASPIENVAQYADCRDNGHGSSGSNVFLGEIGNRDPGTSSTFRTAECIVGRLKGKADPQGNFRPYHLQSFKRTPAGQTFFFKREVSHAPGAPPSECLKIKTSVVVGATDVFVTVQRVKQLPPPRADGWCTDNGET